MSIDASFEAANDGLEILTINDIFLRVQPTDIQTLENKSPETVGMLRSSKSFTYASKFVKGSVFIVLAFDINNEVDRINMVKLCTYIDLYPFLFVKSEKLATYTRHTYSDISDFQIYGVHAYSIEARAETQGVYYITLDLEYFNYNPFASKLSFYNLKSQTTYSVNPNSGIPQTTVNSYSVVATDPADSDIFKGFFQKEINIRLAAVKNFLELNNSDFSHFGLKTPSFTSYTKDSDLPNNPNIETFSISTVKDPATLQSNPDPKQDPLTITKYYVEYDEVFNPSTKSTNLNQGNTVLQSIIITKRNYISSLSMRSYTYPVLQYMGKGQVDISLQMAGIAENPDSITSINTVKGAFQQLEANFSTLKQKAAYNVVKIDALINCFSPVFGVITISEKNTLSAQNQGVEGFELYLVEQDNRETIKQAQYTSSGATQNINIQELLTCMERVIQALDNPSTALVTPVPAVGSKTATQRTTGKPGYATQDQINSLAAIETKYGIPLGTLYGIMMCESGGKIAAVNATAVGAFQFTQGTARSYGLLGPGFDNRTNFELEADAAGRLIRDNLKRTGSITTAIENYNGEATKVSYAQKVLQYVSGTVNTATTIFNQLFTPGKSDLQNVADGAGVVLNRAFPGETDHIGDDYSKFKYFIQNSGKFTSDPAKLSIYQSLLQNTYIDVFKLANAGNAMALTCVTINNATLDKLASDLMNKFKEQGIPDLHIQDNFDLDLALSLGITDFRQIPPFFFLQQNVYFPFKNVSDVFDVFKAILNDPDAFAKARDLIQSSATIGLVSSEQKTAFVANISSPIITDYTNVNVSIKEDPLLGTIPLLNGANLSNSKGVLDDTSQTDIFTQNGSTIDPFGIPDIVNQQKISVASYFNQGMNLAFPSLKVYLVEGDETNIVKYFTNVTRYYYELDGIIEASLAQNNDENPIDVFTFRIANPSSVYTDRTVLYDKYAPTVDYKNLGNDQFHRFNANQIIIKPGVRLHVRAGYGNDPNQMECIFNGLITETGGEEVLECIAEGFGRELELFHHGDKPHESAFFLNASTKAIIANALNSKEVEHFGTFKYFGQQDNAGQRLITTSGNGIFNLFRITGKYTNIFLDSINAIDSNYNSNLINFGGLIPGSIQKAWYRYPIFKLTPYDMLKEMEFRHPGTLSKPALYEDSMSYFFGQKEQLYVYRDLDSRLQTDNLSSRSTSTIAKVLNFTNVFQPLYNFIGSTIGIKPSTSIYNAVKALRYKPICDMHIATSEHNIITNNIKATDDFSTVINVQYNDTVRGIDQEDFKNYEIKMDDNLRPSAHRESDLSMPGIDGLISAVRYGTVKMRREAETMYDGCLIMIGNPRIKPLDHIYINDKFRNMNGLIKVRECIHVWSLEDGYKTIVTPGLYAETTYIQYANSNLFPVLGAACRILAESNCDSAKQEYLSGNNFKINLALGTDFKNLTGTFNPNSSDPNSANSAVAGSIAIGTTALTYTLLRLGGITKLFTNDLLNQPVANIGTKLISGASSAASATAQSISRAILSESIFGAGGEAVSLLARGVLGIARFVALDNPITAALSLIAYDIYGNVSERMKGRQPLKIIPLQQNGLEYVAGIYGYQENTYPESVSSNIIQTKRDFVTLKNMIINATSSGY